jgi:hypothetical protein
MKKIPLALFVIAGLLAGCKDNETKVSDSKYYLVNKRNIGTTISTYEFQSKSLTPDFYTFSSENGAFVIDIEAKDEYAYATTYGQKLALKKIDLQSGADVKVVNLYHPAFLELYNNTIVTVGEDIPTPGNETQLFAAVKVYDHQLSLVDSITDDEVSDIFCFKVIDNKLFYSVRNGGQFSIHILDLNSKSRLPYILLPAACTEFVVASDGKLWGVMPDKIICIDAKSENVINVIKDWQTTGPLALYGSQPSVALDESTNTLFYLKPNAQPSLHPYTLYKFNLSTGNSVVAGEIGTAISAPIVWDQKVNSLVSVNGLYSKEGKLLQEFSVPVTNILIAN